MLYPIGCKRCKARPRLRGHSLCQICLAFYAIELRKWEMYEVERRLSGEWLWARV